ncbi:MAG TPA: hypothetical protein PLH37_02250 [bacterium]|nr:hypothetical protein [bacterium]
MKLNFRTTERGEKEKDPKKVLDNMRKYTNLSLIATMFLCAVMPAFGLENTSEMKPIKPMEPTQSHKPEITKQFVDESGKPINTENEDPFGILAEMKEMSRSLPQDEDNHLEQIFRDFQRERALLGYGSYESGYIPAGPDIPIIK